MESLDILRTPPSSPRDRRREGVYIPSKRPSPRDRRREGVYIPSKRRDKMETEEDDEKRLNEERTRFFLKELEEKEKQSEQKMKEYKSERKQMETLQKRLQREKVPFTYIPRPSESRFSVAPLYSETKDVEFREIEKGGFGNLIFMNYLEKSSETNKDACFVYTKLEDVIDAIKLFYMIRVSPEIRLSQAALRDWREAEKDLRTGDPEIMKLYLKTKMMIGRNLGMFVQLLKVNQEGANLVMNMKIYDPRIKKDIFIYDRNIFHLIKEVLYRDYFRVDVDDPDEVKIYFPMIDKFRKCEKSNKRFIVMFLVIDMKDSAHANMMIFDKKTKTVERYEPQGVDPRFYDTEAVDEKLNVFFSKIGYEYLGPDDFCISGLQDIMEEDTMDIYYFEGFCKTWSFLYAFFRLVFSGEEMDRKILNENLSLIMTEFAKEFLEQRYGKEINPENYNFVIEFLYDYLPEILESGKEFIDLINREFDTKLVLKGKTVYVDRSL